MEKSLLERDVLYNTFKKLYNQNEEFLEIPEDYKKKLLGGRYKRGIEYKKCIAAINFYLENYDKNLYFLYIDYIVGKNGILEITSYDHAECIYFKYTNENKYKFLF